MPIVSLSRTLERSANTPAAKISGSSISIGHINTIGPANFRLTTPRGSNHRRRDCLGTKKATSAPRARRRGDGSLRLSRLRRTDLRLLGCICLLTTTLLVNPLTAQTPSPAPVQSEPANKSADAGSDIDQLLTRLVLENIPHDFEETKDWGGQTERWDGVDIQREGLRIRTHRRKKMVNHGTWKKYSASLINPADEFSIEVKNMREAGEGKLGFDVHFQAHLNIDGRQSKWIKGVQLYSVSARGHARVSLRVSLEVEIKMDGAKLPPDMLFVPVATDAQLTIDDFRLDRVGKAGGEIAQQVSKAVRQELDEKVAAKQTKLLNKINQQLDKHQSDLRLSLADAINSKWAPAAKSFLPANIKSEIE